MDFAIFAESHSDTNVLNFFVLKLKLFLYFVLVKKATCILIIYRTLGLSKGPNVHIYV